GRGRPPPADLRVRARAGRPRSAPGRARGPARRGSAPRRVPAHEPAADPQRRELDAPDGDDAHGRGGRRRERRRPDRPRVGLREPLPRRHRRRAVRDGDEPDARRLRVRSPDRGPHTGSVTTKTPAQIELMRTAGSIVREAHEAAATVVGPGVTTAEIDAVVDEVITSRGGEQLFKGQRAPGADPFPAATCVSVNQEIVHGIPGPLKLRGGDIVSVDVGVRYRGWCADAAVTWPVDKVAPKLRKLLE